MMHTILKSFVRDLNSALMPSWLGAKKTVASLLAGTLMYTTLASPLVEAGFWQDRQNAARSRNSNGTQYAMLPAGAGAVTDALPFLDGKNQSGVDLESLSGSSLPAVHSSLSPEQQKLLPAWLNHISSAHGTISQAYFAPNAADRPLIVHIQDVHEQREAQMNISGLINELVGTGAVSLVGLEGATGAFDLTPYRTFPNKAVIGDVADFLVQEHMIGGGEHAGWTAEKDPTLWGVEEVGLYLKNLNSFKAIERTVEYETKRQIELLEKGEEVVQETRGWDESKQKTFSQRTKEDAHDYRYFPEPDVPPVIVTDEMMAKAQAELMTSFSKIASEGNRIIYSTHSHHMINPSWLSGAYIVENTALDYDVGDSFGLSSKPTNVQITKYRDFVSQYPTRSSYFQPVIEKLEYASPEVIGTEPFVIVEGVSDYYALRLAALVSNIDMKFRLMPGVGAGSCGPLICLLLGRGERFVILLDDDKTGRKEAERYRSEWFLDAESVFTLGDVDTAFEGMQLETLLTTDTLKHIETKLGMNCPPNKKQIGWYLAEMCAANPDTGCLSPNTLTNLCKVLTYLDSKFC